MNDHYPSLLSPVYRKRTLLFLEEYIAKKEKEYSSINRWGPDVCKRLSEFVPRGKLIRGSLVMFINEALGGTYSKDVLHVAAAVELFHSGLLIQDDFMDKDLIRRGKKSIFYQYQLLGEKEKLSQALHFGQSLSVCSGDFAFFLGYNLISGIASNNTVKKVSSIFSKELEIVALAQMEDVYLSYSEYLPTEPEIEKLRVLKSGRYTISLPLMVGGAMADVQDSILTKLKNIGEKTGLVFQLRDDELGIFGQEKKTGKTEGTDIKENKKTLHRFLLYKKILNQDLRKIDKIFGNHRMSRSDLEYIRELMVKTGVVKEIKERVNQLQLQIQNELVKLRLGKQHEAQFMEFVRFLAVREK